MERTRVWRGTVRPEGREEHEQFVTWLNSDEAAVQYAKYGLNGYTLSQQGEELAIAMAAEEATTMIRFLRNSRMWPEIWEFQASGPGASEPEPASVRVRWRRPAAAERG